jgi:hypothetical protein
MGLLFALLDGAALGFVVYATARPHHVARMLGLTDRKDLASPGSLRKDESGMPTGCYGLNFN